MHWQSNKHLNAPTWRRLRFESLEDRRLLAIIADTFAPTFAQVYHYGAGSEITFLTADNAGHSKIFYHPNDELGYIDPETGNRLNADYYPGTSTVLVLDVTPNGNISDLVGLTYSNGQVIATNGGNTIYHMDGSIMRQNGVWTYDSGGTLENASGNFFWSNGNQLETGSLLYHANGAPLRDASNSLLYAGGATFDNAATGFLSYVGGQTLRNASSDYFYASGTTLKSAGAIRYANNTVMVDASGNVYNDTGTLSFTPFTRTQDIGASEYYTHVEGYQSDNVFSTANNVSDETGAYVSEFHLTYQVLPPNPLNITVTAPNATSLRFTWATGGGTTTGYRLAVANGVSPPGDPSSGTYTVNNYYDVTGLAAGQKVSIRVWASDGSGLMSSGVFATGTAGHQAQAVQTGEILASSLDTTFAQVVDSSAANLIYTVDQEDNYLVALYVSYEIGYVNIANGDRLLGDYYTVPSTNSLAPEVTDFRPTGHNLSDIPDGAKYSNGATVRSGSVYYYDTGAVLRDGSGNWFHPNGTRLEDATGDYWQGGTVAIHSGSTSEYPNGNTLKTGTTITYNGGTAFLLSPSAFFPNGNTLKNVAGNLFYETAAQLFNNGSSTFRYRSGPTMIDATGMPFDTTAAPLTVPFDNTDPVGVSTVYVGEDADRIARYAISIQTTNAVKVLGGTVDYAARNGDFNHDGTVDSADYVVWRATQGSTFDLSADANANGTIDQPDYDIWRAHFRQTLPPLPAAATGSSNLTASEGLSSAAVSLRDADQSAAIEVRIDEQPASPSKPRQQISSGYSSIAVDSHSAVLPAPASELLRSVADDRVRDDALLLVVDKRTNTSLHAASFDISRERGDSDDVDEESVPSLGAQFAAIRLLYGQASS